MRWTIDEIIGLMKDRSASDIVLVAGSKPVLWVQGKMVLLGTDTVTADDVSESFLPLLAESQRDHLERTGDIDFSMGKAGVGRLRINIHRQRGSLSAATRFIPHEVPTFETLKLPQRVLEFADLARGIVLVTGGAGSGKSTTLASMIDYMNQTYHYHIITLEDPIEFAFSHNKSIIEQRQVGDDCESFASALRHIVRQRPDVILVGEMRDLETISAALTAAEIGHLVLASLHTVNAVETINRIVDIFPAAQQTQTRVQLACSLQGVVCQSLFVDEKDGGLVPSTEILVPTPAIRRAIRDNETHLLAGMVETGKGVGMRSMDSSIAELIGAGRVSLDAGLAKAHNPEKLVQMVP